MKPGEVEIRLKNLDKIDIGEYIITNGNIHTLYSPYLRGNKKINKLEISTNTLKIILRDHSDITYADLACILMS